VKATENCNANCVYCSVADKHMKRSMMSFEVVASLLDRVREYLARDARRRVTLTWHGGEPALLGATFFHGVNALCGEILGSRRTALRHLVQSNITLVDDELAHAWKSLGIHGVGSSYEYHPKIRGLGVSVDAAAYQAQFFRGLQILDRFGMDVGVIYVVTRASVHEPERCMVLLSNLLGKSRRGHFRLNPLYSEGEAARGSAVSLSVTPSEFGHFLGRAYRYWYPRRWLLRGVGPFNALCAHLESGTASLGCELSGQCGWDHLGVGVTGEIFQCGRALDNQVLTHQSLATQSFDDVLDGPMKQAIIGRLQTLREGHCAGCSFWELCHGGCPVDGQIYHGDWRQHTHLCETHQVFYGQYVMPIHAARSAASGIADSRRSD
jgi:uncharacterized protein